MAKPKPAQTGRPEPRAASRIQYRGEASQLGTKREGVSFGFSDQGYCFITCVPRKIIDEGKSEEFGPPLDHPDLPQRSKQSGVMHVNC